MSDRVPPIARIRLSRSLPRLLALPVLGAIIGVATVVGGLAAIPGVPGIAVAAVGTSIAIVSLWSLIVPLTIHLDVEEAAVRVSWLGGEQVHTLSPGPVTRVRFRGKNASRLRPARRWVPWQLGDATLRDEEPIRIVRLAATSTAILVPTEGGRLAIAAADEGALLDALSRAAQARQRLEDLTRGGAAAEDGQQHVAAIGVDPALMTGIERALWERRLAEERTAAAAAAAEAERQAAAAPAVPVDLPRVTHEERAPRPRRRLRPRLQRPAWLQRPGRTAAIILLPLASAGVTWGIAALLGRMPAAGTDLGRLVALGLVLAGPATTIAAIMARVWWPRLVVVVVTTGLATVVFIGRGLLG